MLRAGRFVQAMPKVTVQEVKDAGFRAEQFGTPASFDLYLETIIADAGTWSSDQVGAAVYAATTSGIGLLRLRRAELCFVKAQLWRNRMAFLDGNAQSSLEGNASAANERKTYEQHAADADLCADYWLLQFTTNGNAPAAGSGAVMGHITTGPFAGVGSCR